MAIRRWSPMRDMMRLRSELDRLFEENYEGNRSQAGHWGLSLDVAEKEDEYVVRASLPGMDPEDIDVTLTNNMLTIQGETQSDKTTTEDQYHMRERRYGRFSRTISLPSDVDSDKVECTYENGVLTLHAPKTETARSRRIEVRSQSGETTEKEQEKQERSNQ